MAGTQICREIGKTTGDVLQATSELLDQDGLVRKKRYGLYGARAAKEDIAEVQAIGAAWSEMERAGVALATGQTVISVARTGIVLP